MSKVYMVSRWVEQYQSVMADSEEEAIHALQEDDWADDGTVYMGTGQSFYYGLMVQEEEL